jgi:hypothetical protein
MRTKFKALLALFAIVLTPILGATVAANPASAAACSNSSYPAPPFVYPYSGYSIGGKTQCYGGTRYDVTYTCVQFLAYGIWWIDVSCNSYSQLETYVNCWPDGCSGYFRTTMTAYDNWSGYTQTFYSSSYYIAIGPW